MNFKQILKKIDFWRVQDEKLQKNYNEFNNVFCHGSHNPIIEYNVTDSFIDGVISCFNYKELQDDLEYYVYEMNDEDRFYVTYKSKKYNKKNFHEYLDLVYNKNN